MNFILNLFFMFTSFLSTFSYASLPIRDNHLLNNTAQSIQIKHMEGPLYIVEDHHYTRENSMIYIGENFITIIGATWTPKTAQILKDEIRKISKKPIKAVINTNHHPDRAGGNAFWKSIGVDIISTQKTYDMMKEQWDIVMKTVYSSFQEYPKIGATLPTLVYPEEFSIESGNIRALYLGASHTEDGIFIYFPKEKVLYGGCILKEALGNLDFANLQEYPKTLQKLKDMNLDIKAVVAGHFSSIHSPKIIDDYLTLLKNQDYQ